MARSLHLSFICIPQSTRPLVQGASRLRYTDKAKMQRPGHTGRKALATKKKRKRCMPTSSRPANWIHTLDGLQWESKTAKMQPYLRWSTIPSRMVASTIEWWLPILLLLFWFLVLSIVHGLMETTKGML